MGTVLLSAQFTDRRTVPMSSSQEKAREQTILLPFLDCRNTSCFAIEKARWYIRAFSDRSQSAPSENGRRIAH